MFWPHRLTERPPEGKIQRLRTVPQNICVIFAAPDWAQHRLKHCSAYLLASTHTAWQLFAVCIIDQGMHMKDERGLYYHPQPGNTKVRVYVRRGQDNDVEFRLWESEHAEVWEKHHWLPTAVIREAAEMYRQMGRGAPGADPMVLYDVAVARALLEEAGL